jgi:hypothetical protein
MSPPGKDKHQVVDLTLSDEDSPPQLKRQRRREAQDAGSDDCEIVMVAASGAERRLRGSEAGGPSNPNAQDLDADEDFAITGDVGQVRKPFRN